MKATVKKQLQSLKDNVDALAYMVQEVNSWDGSLESYEVYEFDDEFFSMMFEGRPEEAARATFFGNIQNWMDDYIRINGHGNLESLNEYQRNDELKSGADEIVERYIELVEKGDIEADHLLKEYAK